MFQRCDQDGDGKLSFKEFQNLILRSRERKDKLSKDSIATAGGKSITDMTALSSLADISSLATDTSGRAGEIGGTGTNNNKMVKTEIPNLHREDNPENGKDGKKDGLTRSNGSKSILS